MELNTVTVMFQIVNFLLFFFLISKFFYGPVKKILDDRKNQIKREIDEAEALKASANDLREEYENKIRCAREEAQEIVKSAVSSGEMMKNDILSDAKAEAQREKERAAEEITVEREKALKELKVHTADIAISVAQKVLRETLDRDSQERLIKEFVRKVESGNVV